MDRKLFFSYIQNMQQNNQEMTGFQNSMRKNSWQKPKSLYEMNGGGHVYQGDFDREDAARQLGRDADKQRSDLSDKSLERITGDVSGIAAKAHEEWLANDGTGHPRDTFGEAEITDYLNDHPSWRTLSDDAKNDVRRDFMDHLSDIHYVHMVTQAAAGRDWYADRGMTHADPHNPLREAVLRTNSPASYPRSVLGREVEAKASLGRVVARLMDPNDDIHNPENAELKGSLMRVINDKGVTPHLQALSVGKVSGGESFEVIGAPANDPTKTGPGTPSANVDDLRKYVEYKKRGVYRFNKPK